jgi:hypothetical protein
MRANGQADREPRFRLDAAAEVIREFGLAALSPLLRASAALAGDEAPLDVAVLGQFKSGKSSLLNAGLGSVFVHNTEATRAWMPNIGVALVAVSADRPLSDEDRRLVGEALLTAPRVVVLLTEAELAEMTAFLDRALRVSFGDAVPVLPFSSRVEPERWVGRLPEAVLLPVARDVAGGRRAALGVKLASLVRACRACGGYCATRTPACRGPPPSGWRATAFSWPAPR